MKDFVDSEVIESKDMRRGRLFDLLRLSEDGEAADLATVRSHVFELSDYELASIQAHALQSFNRARA